MPKANEIDPIWQPHYVLTPPIVRGLMEIEGARAVVAHTPLPPAAAAELRRRARIRSTHYSTQIEGNRLTLAEAEQVIGGRPIPVLGRERDIREVRNYWNAFLRVEERAAQRAPLTQELIRRLHSWVERGPRARPTPYREGQNVIRDAVTGRIVYLPPAAADVPALMGAVVEWVVRAEKEALPVPLVAALVHYQIVTIHPYYDGNGRTARLLATFILHRGSYGLHGIFSLEEYHARDLPAYYRALAVHPHYSYYEGRAEADLTPWLEYFISTLSRVFTIARDEALRVAGTGVPAEPEELRRLDQRARAVLALFVRTEQITSGDVAHVLGLSTRMARELLREWVEAGWLEIADPSRRARAYRLAAGYRQFIGNSSATQANE